MKDGYYEVGDRVILRGGGQAEGEIVAVRRPEDEIRPLLRGTGLDPRASAAEIEEAVERGDLLPGTGMRIAGARERGTTYDVLLCDFAAELRAEGRDPDAAVIEDILRTMIRGLAPVEPPISPEGAGVRRMEDT